MINKIMYLIGCIAGRLGISGEMRIENYETVDAYVKELKTIMDDLEMNYDIVKKKQPRTRKRKAGVKDE